MCVCVQVLPPLLLGLCHLQGQLAIVQTSVILPSVHSVITVCHTYLLRLASLYYNCYFPLCLLRLPVAMDTLVPDALH